MSDTKINYIYVLKDPLTNELMYVGKTTNPKKRLNQHINNSKKRKTYVNIWVNNLLQSNNKPIMEIIDSCIDNNWVELERKWTELIYLENKKLCNLTYIKDKDTRNPDYSINLTTRKNIKLFEEINFLIKNKKLDPEIVKKFYTPKEYNVYHNEKRNNIRSNKLNSNKFKYIYNQELDGLTDEMKFVRMILLEYSKKGSCEKYPIISSHYNNVFKYIKQHKNNIYYREYTSQDFNEMLITIIDNCFI